MLKAFKKALWAITFVSFLLSLGVFAVGEICTPGNISARKEARSMEETILSLEKGAMKRWQYGDPWGFTDISAPDVTYFDTGTPSRLDGLEASFYFLD